MKQPIIRNIFALLAGIIIGSIVNMGIITLFGSIVPAPDGVDVNDIESIKENIHLYKPIHFFTPFLAHAIGTLVGAFVTTKIAISHQFILAMIIGVVFLFGGLSMVMMLPAPMWFNVLDLTVAYIPMAWLGYRLASKKND